MALTIAVCVGGFVWIFAEVDPFLRDFIAAERATSTPEREDEVSQDAPEEEPAEENSDDESDQTQEQDPEEPAPTPTTPPSPTPTPEAFTPELQSNSAESVNLRSEPSTAGGNTTVIIVLPPSTPLRATGDRSPAENPAQDGDFWVEVETEAGEIGWIREIDTGPFQP